MFFTSGIIALDIDGTVTDQAYSVHHDVVDYLKMLNGKGWQIIFISGRPYKWGMEIVRHFNFELAFGVQNGALILEIPAHTILDRKYLDELSFQKIFRICSQLKTGFVIYSGWENKDLCYYNPSHFSSQILDYIEKRASTLKEPWITVSNFDELLFNKYPSLKCFSNNLEEAFALSKRIEEETGLHAPVNKDPFNKEYYVIQITHAEANKGSCLRSFINKSNVKGPIIAAGDDFNDIPMFNLADIAVVMNNAPSKVLEWADVVAPPASEEGLISGLEEAIRKLHDWSTKLT